MTNEEWAKAIIIHLTGKPEEPTPMLLKMVSDVRQEGFALAKIMAEGEAQWCRSNGESDMRSVISRIRGLTPDSKPDSDDDL